MIKLSATDGTGYDNVGRVDNPMHMIAACLAEALVAVRTLVRLVLRVHKLVVTQMVLTAKRLAAHVTRKRPFVGVRSFVDHKVVGFGEFTLAKFADKPFLWPSASSVVCRQ